MKTKKEQLQKFKVTITECYTREIEVLAKNQDTAYDSVNEMISEGYIDLPLDDGGYIYDRELCVKATEKENETKLVFGIADHYIAIQKCAGGYDYTVFDNTYDDIYDGFIRCKDSVSVYEVMPIIVTELKESPDFDRIPAYITDILIKIDAEDFNFFA